VETEQCQLLLVELKDLPSGVLEQTWIISHLTQAQVGLKTE